MKISNRLKQFIIVLFCFNICLTSQTNPLIPDVTVCGYIGINDGIGGITTRFVDKLYGKIGISMVSARGNSVVSYGKDPIPYNVAKTLNNFPNATFGRVAIFFDPLASQLPGQQSFLKRFPESSLKIAYSMIEFSKVPLSMARIHNESFDACVVPDVYQKKCL